MRAWCLEGRCYRNGRLVFQNVMVQMEQIGSCSFNDDCCAAFAMSVYEWSEFIWTSSVPYPVFGISLLPEKCSKSYCEIPLYEMLEEIQAAKSPPDPVPK